MNNHYVVIFQVVIRGGNEDFRGFTVLSKCLLYYVNINHAIDF